MVGPASLTLRARLLLASIAAAAAVVLALPWGGAGGRPLATPGAARAGDPSVAGSVYVVQPGDTLWTIAERLDAGGDPRPIVTELASDLGSDTVVPGERIRLP